MAPIREIILDTETTGFNTSEGHRLVEVGAIELIDGVPTGRTFHGYFNPEREVPPEAVKVHGLTTEFLSDKPLFSSRADELRDFIGNSRVVITCRTFGDYTLDIAFLNKEWADAGVGPVPDSQWLNVRRWGEALFGNDKASMDYMLPHYGIDKTKRDKNGHGALLDAELLSKIYHLLRRDYEALKQNPPPPPAPQ